MRSLIIVLLIVASCTKANAALLYATQAGAGSKDGSALVNAWDMGSTSTGINNAGNWSATPGTSGKICGDNTLILNGTITGSLTTQAAGTSGHVITILGAAGAKFSASPYSGIAITVNHSNITVDNIGIESLDNGTGLANQVNCSGVYINGAANVTVQNMNIGPLYIRTAGGEQNAYGQGIFFDSTNGNCNNAVATNNIVNNCEQGITVAFGIGQSNATITNNTISYINWGVTVKDNNHAGESITGSIVSGNTISQWANWNDTVSNNFHHNGVFVVTDNATGTNNGIIVSNNTIGPGFGGTYQTAAVYINGGVTNPNVFNNLIIPALGESTGNAMFTIGFLYYATTVNVYNNTCIQPAGVTGGTNFYFYPPSGGASINYILRNNIVQGPWFYNVNFTNTGGFCTLTANHNIYYNAPTFSVGAGNETLVAWQGFGFDTDAITANPSLDGTYHLGAGSSAISAGANLTALGITLLNSDKSGSSRPAGSAAWDNGVYNFFSSGSTTSCVLGGKINLTGKITIK